MMTEEHKRKFIAGRAASRGRPRYPNRAFVMRTLREAGAALLLKDIEHLDTVTTRRIRQRLTKRVIKIIERFNAAEKARKEAGLRC